MSDGPERDDVDDAVIGDGRLGPDDASGGATGPAEGIPAGQVYDWYRRARQLHDDGDPAAAVQLLLWAVAAEPEARSVREALARAQFDDRRFREAADNFGFIVEQDPADHYAHFGLGLSASRAGDLDIALNHLALAVALRPDLPHYEKALRSARAAVARRGRPLSDEDEGTAL